MVTISTADPNGAGTKITVDKVEGAKVEAPGTGESRGFGFPIGREPSRWEGRPSLLAERYSAAETVAKHLYQSVLNTLAAPTLVVLHFPVHAFQAE